MKEIITKLKCDVCKQVKDETIKSREIKIEIVTDSIVKDYNFSPDLCDEDVQGLIDCIQNYLKVKPVVNDK